MSDTKLTCSDHANPGMFLRYDPDTGELTRKALENRSDGWNKRYANQPAGFVNNDKNGKPRYIYVYMDGRFYAAHRLAWRLFYGCQPSGHIDHINGNGLDNRIDNLRCVTVSENAKNRKIRPDNRSGLSGVVWSETHKKWISSVRYNKKQINLGAFHDFFEAVCARKSAETKCGYHANHDRENANTQVAPRRMTMSEIASARPLREVICSQCGKAFTAKDPRAKFCSNRCRQADAYARGKKYRKVGPRDTANPPTAHITTEEPSS